MHEKNNKISFEIGNATIIRVILWGVLLWALYYLWELVLVVLTAVVVATFIEAAANRLRRFGINRTLSVISIYVLTIGALTGIFYLFVPILIVETSNLISILSKYLPNSELIQSISANPFIGANQVASPTFGTSLSEILSNTRDLMSQVSGGFLGVVTGVFGGIVNLALIIVISFYLSIQVRGIEKFLRLITPYKNETYVIDLWERTQRKIALWVRGQLILGLIVGVLTYLGLALLGVQYALLLALLTAIFELIPFGILLAIVPAISFAYIDGGITLALLVAGFYIVVQQFENYLISPLLVKKVIGISPLVVILSVLIGAKLAGFWGLILAIPVAVALLEYADDIEKRKLSRAQHM